VDLELRRKLAELDERYAMQATLAPVVVIRTQTPVTAVALSVFRKQAHAVRTVYWNPLVKHFDPIACTRCGEGTFAAAFTEEEVQALCPACAK
jgi:formylmethanofuran dehydrogenase subunit E